MVLEIAMAEITLFPDLFLIKVGRIFLKLLCRRQSHFIKKVVVVQQIDFKFRFLAFFPQITAHLLQFSVMLYIFIFHAESGHIIIPGNSGLTHGLVQPSQRPGRTLALPHILKITLPAFKIGLHNIRNPILIIGN